MATALETRDIAYFIARTKNWTKVTQESVGKWIEKYNRKVLNINSLKYGKGLRELPLSDRVPRLGEIEEMLPPK